MRWTRNSVENCYEEVNLHQIVPMRITLLRLLDSLTKTLEFPGPIYEFGAYRVPGQEHLPHVRDYFPGKQFVGCDLRPGPGVDQIQDLHDLRLPDNSIGTAILFDTIEHVREPWRALDEIWRCLAPGGTVLMTSVWYFPVHAFPDDYFRFTASGFQSLLQKFDSVIVASCGLERLPHTVVAVASKGELDPPKEAALRREVEFWKKHQSRTWKETVLDACPPFLLIPGYSSFLRLMSVIHRRSRPARANEIPREGPVINPASGESESADSSSD
jgi:SAM-dependent methyltransferase